MSVGSGGRSLVRSTPDTRPHSLRNVLMLLHAAPWGGGEMHLGVTVVGFAQYSLQLDGVTKNKNRKTRKHRQMTAKHFILGRAVRRHRHSDTATHRKKKTADETWGAHLMLRLGTFQSLCFGATIQGGWVSECGNGCRVRTARTHLLFVRPPHRQHFPRHHGRPGPQRHQLHGTHATQRQSQARAIRW